MCLWNLVCFVCLWTLASLIPVSQQAESEERAHVELGHLWAHSHLLFWQDAALQQWFAGVYNVASLPHFLWLQQSQSTKILSILKIYFISSSTPFSRNPLPPPPPPVLLFRRGREKSRLECRAGCRGRCSGGLWEMGEEAGVAGWSEEWDPAPSTAQCALLLVFLKQFENLEGVKGYDLDSGSASPHLDE